MFDPDPLREARGVVLGIALGVALWAVLITAAVLIAQAVK